mmetsp:Transcript_11091/g.20751  ORF Transcript_11091/g.20751 Transcript_11091/m.20751 type:complete len:437 (+) Transcript_11091:413-1723(+)
MFQAAATSNQDIEKIKTVVKATKALPRLTAGGRDLFGGMEDEEEDRDLETKLKSLGLIIDGLMASKGLAWEVDVKEEGGMMPNGVWMELVEKVKMLEKAVVLLSGTASESVKELQLGVAIRLAGLEGLIGSFSMLSEHSVFAGASIASAIEQLQEQVEELKKSSLVKDVIAAVMKSQDMQTFSDGLTDAFRTVMRRIISVEESMEEVRVWQQNKDTKQEASMESPSVLMGRDWLGETMTSRNAEDVGSMTVEAEGQAASTQEMLLSLAKRMDDMEKNGGVNSKMEGEDISVFFMGHRFSSERDVNLYVRSLSNAVYVLPVGLVTDCYSIIYELNREVFDSKNKLGVTDLAKVAQLAKKQADVYNILAGVEHGLPDFFDPPSASGKIYIDGKHGKKHRFANIPTYEVWGPVGADGFNIRKKATGVLARLVTTRKSEI